MNEPNPTEPLKTTEYKVEMWSCINGDWFGYESATDTKSCKKQRDIARARFPKVKFQAVKETRQIL
jgi:hypothetical protein